MLRDWYYGADNAPSHDQEFKSALSLLATRNNSCRSASRDSALETGMAPYPLIRAGRVSSKASHIWDASEAKTRRRSFLEGWRSYFGTKEAMSV